MAAEGDVTINISADTSQLESAVKSAEQNLLSLGASGAEGGEKAAKGLDKAEKATKAAEKATREAAKSGKEAKSSFDQMGDSAGKVGAASAKMRGALDLLSPSAAEAAGLINDLGDAGEVLSQALGALGPYGRVAAGAFAGLAVIVPVVGEAMMDQTAASDELQAQFASLERATLAAAEAQRTYDAALKGARAETDVILGLKSQEQVATEKAIDAMREQTQRTLDANQAVIVSETITREKIRADIEAGNTTADRTILEQRFKLAIQESTEREERATLANRAARAELERYIDVKQGELSSLEKEKRDREAEGKARAWQAQQAERLRREEAAYAKVVEEARKRVADQAAAMKAAAEAEAKRRGEIDKTTEALTTAGQSAELRAALEYKAQAKAIEDEIILRQKAGEDVSRLEFAKSEAVRLANESMVKIEEDAATKRKAAADAEKEHFKLVQEEKKQAALDAAAVMLDTFSSLSNSVGQLAQLEADKRMETVDKLEARLEEGEDTLTKEQKKQIRERIKQEKEAAKNAFLIQQSAQIAVATMNAAQAVLNALANIPAPLNIAAAAAAGIAGAVQVGIIASQKPKFHAGGMVYPDEGNATLLGGEAVLNRRATETIGADAVDALNAGRNIAAPAPMLRIGRLEAREILRTDMLGGGYLVSNLSRYVAPSSSRTVFA